MKKAVIIVLTVCMIIFSFSCASLNKTGRGAIIGAAGGAVVGGAIGAIAGNTLLGAIAGAALGGAAGAYIGRHMDKQAAEMRRTWKGQGRPRRRRHQDHLRLGPHVRRQQVRSPRGEPGEPDQAGHDPQQVPRHEHPRRGPHRFDRHARGRRALSENRTKAVAAYLETLKVLPSRFAVHGYGPTSRSATMPASTTAGRIGAYLAVLANDKLKQVAQVWVREPRDPPV